VRSVVAGIAVVVATLAIGLVLARAGRPAELPPPARPLPPAVHGAFATGGVPARDAALHELLAGDLMEFVAAVDRHKPPPPGLRAVLERAEPIRAHGPALAAAWHALLGWLDHWVVDGSGRDLQAKVHAVSDQLAAVGLGYFLEGDIMFHAGRAHVFVFAYRVEDVRFLHVMGLPRRVLSLRRIDRVNLMHNELGLQSEELGDPVVLLDQIDQHVVHRTLPVLAPDARYDLDDDVDPDMRELQLAAGAAVRGELRAALGRDAEPAAAVARLLAERARILAGHRLRVDELLLPPDALQKIAPDLADGEAERLAAIEGELVEGGAVELAWHCRDVIAASVRRHEAQHGIDGERAEPLRYPDALAELVHNERARAELAAYLSQIANDPVTPRLALWNVLRFAFEVRMMGSAESYAAVVIASGLARELAIPSAGPVVHDGVIDRVPLVRIARPLAAVSGERLRAAARALWQTLYREPLIPIVD
jgi:hypothetical protein